MGTTTNMVFGSMLLVRTVAVIDGSPEDVEYKATRGDMTIYTLYHEGKKITASTKMFKKPHTGFKLVDGEYKPFIAQVQHDNQSVASSSMTRIQSQLEDVRKSRIELEKVKRDCERKLKAAKDAEEQRKREAKARRELKSQLMRETRELERIQNEIEKTRQKVQKIEEENNRKSTSDDEQDLSNFDIPSPGSKRSAESDDDEELLMIDNDESDDYESDSVSHQSKRSKQQSDDEVEEIVDKMFDADIQDALRGE